MPCAPETVYARPKPAETAAGKYSSSAISAKRGGRLRPVRPPRQGMPEVPQDGSFDFFRGDCSRTCAPIASDKAVAPLVVAKCQMPNSPCSSAKPRLLQRRGSNLLLLQESSSAAVEPRSGITPNFVGSSKESALCEWTIIFKSQEDVGAFPRPSSARACARDTVRRNLLEGAFKVDSVKFARPQRRHTMSANPRALHLDCGHAQASIFPGVEAAHRNAV